MAIYLEGVSAIFYRGIGKERQLIAPFGDVNVFVGQNNSGKSVVLSLIHDHLPFGSERRKTEPGPGSADYYMGAESGPMEVSVGVSRQKFAENAVQQVLAGLQSQYANDKVASAIDRISSVLSVQDHVWIEPGTKSGRVNRTELKELRGLSNRLDGSDFNQVFHAMRAGGPMYNPNDLFEEVLNHMFGGQRPRYPERMIIPAKREIGPSGESFDDLTGKGLIDHLSELQHPDHHEREKREIFDQINEFVQSVTGKDEAELEVPSSKQHLLVKMDKKVLPLSSLGTGIHEVILIGAFCTIHQNKIMCLEEPEIHLHPILQRKLMRYLMEKTDNQYFIATHSSAFIDMPGTSVFHVSNDGVQTYVKPAILKGDRRVICDELGYRASDIVQANAIVWVEGPSDRTYLRRWLHEFDPELVEGVHYSIMFFGGGLISHLSADDETVDDFIKLHDLNRNMAIMIDSDRTIARAQLKPAVKRLKKEFDDKGAFAWVTNGREVENYVDPAVLQKALSVRYPKIYGEPCQTDKFDHAYFFRRKGTSRKKGEVETKVDKVRLAQIVCEGSVSLDVLDLKVRIKEISEMIRRANEL